MTASILIYLKWTFDISLHLKCHWLYVFINYLCAFLSFCNMQDLFMITTLIGGAFHESGRSYLGLNWREKHISICITTFIWYCITILDYEFYLNEMIFFIVYFDCYLELHEFRFTYIDLIIMTKYKKLIHYGLKS